MKGVVFEICFSTSWKNKASNIEYRSVLSVRRTVSTFVFHVNVICALIVKKTMDHNVVIYQEKFNHNPEQVIYLRDPNSIFGMFCETCDLPICYHCPKHKQHRQLEVRTAYKRKRQQHRRTIIFIRSEALFYRPALLIGTKADVQICHEKICNYQSEMLTIGNSLKDLIDNELCFFDFKHRCMKQKRK